MTHVNSDGLRAVLLDLDGTLVDTVDLWRSAYLRLADELGVTLPDGFWPSIAGRSMEDSLEVLGPAARRPGSAVLVDRLVQLASADLASDGPGGWSWMPGAAQLLDLLWGPRPDGRPGPTSALVTSAWRAFTDPLLAAMLTDRAGHFDAVVCGDDVVRSKPFPDPYLRAAELLDVAPSHCLVIEDSPTGAAAAQAAGMVVLAVPHAAKLTAVPGRAVRRDLLGLTSHDLRDIHARLRSEAEDLARADTA